MIDFSSANHYINKRYRLSMFPIFLKNVPISAMFLTTNSAPYAFALKIDMLAKGFRKKIPL